MKTTFILIMLLNAFSFASSYSISNFASTEPYGSPDEFIDAEFNGELRKAKANAIRSDRFYVRQKYEDPFDDDATTYELFEGSITKSGKAKLSKFSYDEIPYSEMLKLKFYSSKDANPNYDIDRIYFDGNFFYVYDEAAIYINVDGETIELRPSSEKSADIELGSQPSGAEIFIDGSPKGTTPTKITLTGTSATLVTLKKPGYYDAIKVITPVAGNTIKEGLLLIKKDTIENIALSFKKEIKQLQAKGDEDGLNELKGKIEDAIEDWDSQSSEEISKIMDNYPPNQSQNSDESADNYKTRTEAWEKNREAEEESLKEIAENIKSELESLLANMDDAIDNIGGGLSSSLYDDDEDDEYQSEDSYASSYAQEEDDDDEIDIPDPDYQDVEDEVYSQADYDDSFTDIDAVFDRSDEYRKWTAWGLIVGSAASLTVGVLQHMEHSKLKKHYDNSQEMIDNHINSFTLNPYCNGEEVCIDALIAASRNEENGFLNKYEAIQEENKKTLNSYSFARNLFLGIAAVGIAGSIVLFTW
ncbi:MAG: PEGA domain-containing protein [Fibrobacter sp.]|nr:PEGA domain-containing protein [Fibrobacter sp.]